jgi:hypothetical protein
MCSLCPDASVSGFIFRWAAVICGICGDAADVWETFISVEAGIAFEEHGGIMVNPGILLISRN